MELKQNRLLQLLAASPEITLLGVVDASGAGGSNTPGEEPWVLRFALVVWHVEGTPVKTEKLTVQRQVTKQELRQYMDRIKPYTVLRIRAHIAEETDIGSPQALLVEIVGMEESDTELNDWVIRLQEPVTVDDDLFGTFTLDRRSKSYTAQTTWRGMPVALSLDAEELEDVRNALKTANKLWQSQDEWDERIRQFAVRELLQLKNDTWLDEGEAKVTPDQFADRMALESVAIYRDGSFEFWHDDGDLFWGHSIMIDGTIADGPTHADIPG